MSEGDRSTKQANRPLRVLIVEDTPERQKVLVSLYRRHAWILVHTGRRAIAMLDAYEFDIVSLDYNLGDELTGEQVAQFLAGSPGKAARVIVHSMNPDGAQRIKAVLPEAILYPVHRMIRSNKTFKKLQESIATLVAAFDCR